MIRAWLNETFYNTAFTTAKEQNTILLREVTHPVTDPETYFATAYEEPSPSIYRPDDTNDKIFLLSWQDIVENETTYNITKRKQGSDYARAQGLEVETGIVSSNPTYVGNSNYWLRSPDSADKHYALAVDYDYYLSIVSVNYSSYGVVAALKIGL